MVAPYPPEAAFGDDQVAFSMQAYEVAQEERRKELTDHMPMLVGFVKAQNESQGRGDRRHELTAQSYALADREGLSRRAKQEWCDANGCQVINLQHDGAFIRLRRGLEPVWVAERLTDAVSEALGYRQRVEIKIRRHHLESLPILSQHAL